MVRIVVIFGIFLELFKLMEMFDMLKLLKMLELLNLLGLSAYCQNRQSAQVTIDHIESHHHKYIHTQKKIQKDCS